MIFLHRQNNIFCEVNHFGVEIDLRFNGRELVLNHDLLSDGIKYPLFKDKLKFFKNIPMICNIKESNLEEIVIEMLEEGGGRYEYYFLDSQIPDILRISKDLKGKFIIRVSDVETLNKKLIDISQPKYLWVDYSAFLNFNLKNYEYFILNLYKEIDKKLIPILVSPELYDLSFVDLIPQIQSVLPKGFSICTKKPDLWSSYVQS